jgi:hypothetical protein
MFRELGFNRYTLRAPNKPFWLWLQGPLAQSVEQRTFNPWVVGSIPTGPTKKIKSDKGVNLCAQKSYAIVAKKPLGLDAVNILKKHLLVLPNPIAAVASFHLVE